MINLQSFIKQKYRYPIVRQLEKSDCGPAALLSVLKYYGSNDHLIHIRELCRTGPHGTTLYDMIQAAKKRGLKATGVTGRYEDLINESMPVIAHVVIDNTQEHFIVIYKINRNRIIAVDPGRGKIKIKRQLFEEMWKSKIVLLFEAGDQLIYHASITWYSWMSAYLKSESAWIYQSVFLGLISTFLGLLTAFFIQRLIDDYIPNAQTFKIIYTGGLLLIMLSIRAIVGFIRERFLIILNKRLSITINQDFIGHLFKLPKRFFDSRRKGDITSRIHDMIRIQQLVLRLSGSTLVDLMVIMGSLIFIFMLSEQMGLIVLIALPFYTTLLFITNGPIRREQHEVMKSFAGVESIYIDSLNGIDEILSFCAADLFSKTNKTLYGFFQEKLAGLGFIRNRQMFFSEISGSIVVVFALISSALAVEKGLLLLGEMIAAYSLLAYLIPAINRSVDINISLQGAMVALRRLLEVLFVDREYDRGVKSFAFNEILRLKQIKFGWSANKRLFTGIDLEIPRGKIISLWGPSGAGKSTLAQLIQRKYEPDEGKIYIDKQDATKIGLHEYRQKITFIPQNINVFSGTLFENIVLGRPFSFNELNDMTRRYGIEKYFSKFENGMNTLIGDEYRQLSGGEKQLLGLARALLTQPALIIIDEGFNALDIESENLVFSVLHRYARQQAALIITHNIKIVLKTDYLYVLDKGQIVQEGVPQEMINSQGFFSSTVKGEWLRSFYPMHLKLGDLGYLPVYGEEKIPNPALHR
jgi:ATP-binding cassette subfamily B protein